MTGANKTGVAAGLEPWNKEWAAEKASAALRYLAGFYPECSGSEALHAHQDTAHEAALSGDEDAYLEALRGCMRAGGEAALEIRRWAA